MKINTFLIAATMTAMSVVANAEVKQVPLTEKAKNLLVEIYDISRGERDYAGVSALYIFEVTNESDRSAEAKVLRILSKLNKQVRYAVKGNAFKPVPYSKRNILVEGFVNEYDAEDAEAQGAELVDEMIRMLGTSQLIHISVADSSPAPNVDGAVDVTVALDKAQNKRYLVIRISDFGA